MFGGKSSGTYSSGETKQSRWTGIRNRIFATEYLAEAFHRIGRGGDRNGAAASWFIHEPMRSLTEVVPGFSVHGDVEPLLFFVLRGAYVDYQVQQSQNPECDTK